MKRIALGIIVAVLFSFKAAAESPYSSLDYSWKYKDYLNSIEIKAYNKHSSKQIRFELIKIWFSDCDSKSGEADRIYRVNRTIPSYTDKTMLVDANLRKGKMCATTKLSFIEPRKWKPPPKKSGSQKLLDKIIGR